MSLAPILQVSAGNISTGALPRDPKAPELLVAINTCPVPPGEDVPQLDPGQASSVEAILAQIWKRLTGGLDYVWQSPDGHHPEWEPRAESPAPAPGAGPAPSADEIRAEESWARCCSELLDLTPYGAARSYGGGKEDVDFYDAFQSKNPVVPILMACQQLCTYAIMSRGYSPLEMSWKPKGQKKATVGVSAGNNGHLAHLFLGGWDTRRQFADIEQALGRAAGGLTPGSIFAFLPESEDNEQRQGAHVVFVLRIARSVGKVQFLDTGAARTSSDVNRSSEGMSNHVMKTFEGGNYDNMLVKGTVQVSSNTVPYVGLGVLKPREAALMESSVMQARKARPLGIARLAIFRRPAKKTPVAEEDILYVSPRLSMHDAASEDNFYLSRYLWSLRAMPGYQNLQAIWQFRIPQHEFVDKMMAPTRDVPLSKIWMKGAPLEQALYMTVEQSGKAVCISRYRSVLQPDRSTKIVQEPESGLTLYAAVKQRLDATPPGEAFVSGALTGALSLPHDYFKPW